MENNYHALIHRKLIARLKCAHNLKTTRNGNKLCKKLFYLFVNISFKKGKEESLNRDPELNNQLKA